MSYPNIHILSPIYISIYPETSRFYPSLRVVLGCHVRSLAPPGPWTNFLSEKSVRKLGVGVESTRPPREMKLYVNGSTSHVAECNLQRKPNIDIAARGDTLSHHAINIPDSRKFRRNGRFIFSFIAPCPSLTLHTFTVLPLTNPRHSVV